MVHANPEYSDDPAKMATFPLIMAAFWENIEEGATALQAYGNGAEEFDDWWFGIFVEEGQLQHPLWQLEYSVGL